MINGLIFLENGPLSVVWNPVLCHASSCSHATALITSPPCSCSRVVPWFVLRCALQSQEMLQHIFSFPPAPFCMQNYTWGWRSLIKTSPLPMCQSSPLVETSSLHPPSHPARGSSGSFQETHGLSAPAFSTVVNPRNEEAEDRGGKAVK